MEDSDFFEERDLVDEEQLLGTEEGFDVEEILEDNQDEDMNDDSGPKTGEELEAIRARVLEMEEEAKKLKKLQTEVENKITCSKTSTNNVTSPTSTTTNAAQPPTSAADARMEADMRSIYVGNVDYGATAEELETHFHGCGAINRVTIMCNKPDGHPKGYAYVEFTDIESVSLAVNMNESLFRGRQIKVIEKRTNQPGMSRGRGFRRGRGRAPFRTSYGGYRSMRGGRPRGSNTGRVRGSLTRRSSIYRFRRPSYAPY